MRFGFRPHDQRPFARFRPDTHICLRQTLVWRGRLCWPHSGFGNRYLREGRLRYRRHARKHRRHRRFPHLFACILLSLVTRGSIAEIDLGARRLKVSRRFLGRWTKTIVDCSLDECSALGTFETETDGPSAYSVYVKVADGTRQTIPLTDSTLNEAARVASQLSAATGIPRLDIYVGPIYISPDDNTSRRDR